MQHHIFAASYVERIDVLFVSIKRTAPDDPTGTCVAQVSLDFGDDEVQCHFPEPGLEGLPTRIQVIAAVLDELQSQTTGDDTIPFVDAALRLAEAKHEIAI